MEVYADLRQQVFGNMSSMKRGDPQATADAVLKIVDTDAPPLRFFLGSENLPLVRAAYADRLAVWEEWEAVSNAAQGMSK